MVVARPDTANVAVLDGQGQHAAKQELSVRISMITTLSVFKELYIAFSLVKYMKNWFCKDYCDLNDISQTGIN